MCNSHNLHRLPWLSQRPTAVAMPVLSSCDGSYRFSQTMSLVKVCSVGNFESFQTFNACTLPLSAVCFPVWGPGIVF